MVDSIKNSVAQIGSQALSKPDGQGASKGAAFGDVLKDSIDKVNKLQNEADQAIQGLAKGEVNNIHDTMIAIEKANLSFNMMVQVRNKLLQAYEEVMRTQV